MENPYTPHGQSALVLILRRCAHASGAMQGGLEKLAASGETSLAPLNPLAWIAIAAAVLAAAMREPSNGASPAIARVASSGEQFAWPIVEDGLVPLAPKRPAFILPPKRPGWGGSPFHPPAPVATGATAPAPAAEPSVKASDLVRVINQDAMFCIFSVPDKTGHGADIPWYDSPDTRSIIGFQLSESLHRLSVLMAAPTNHAPLSSRYTPGEALGTSNWRWLLAPDDFVITPDSEPPLTRLDPDVPQRFAMLDGLFKIGDSEDGFRGKGMGQTFPATVRGRKELRVMALGTLHNGFGKFKGRDDGVFVYCGSISASGFHGAIVLRTGDVAGRMLCASPLPALEPEKTPLHGITWLTLYAEGQSPAAAALEADDNQPGITYEQQLRLIEIDASTRTARGLECVRSVRQLVGVVKSRIAFDPSFGSGHPDDPVPFAVWREFSFQDALGKPVGGFVTESGEGIAIATDICGIRGFRAGSSGRVVSGTGRFEGMTALITENSVLVQYPCVTSSVYFLRVEDSEGRFLAHTGLWRDIPVSEVVQTK